TTLELAPWLKIEFRADEVDCPESTQALIVDACLEVATRLGFEVGPPVLITVLTIESDAVWAVGRFGYFVDKYPYDKICVPTRDMSDTQRLRSTVMHEFAHAVVLNLADGHAPRWL